MDFEFRFFDPGLEVDITRRNLPHWEQNNAYYFLTWRTVDSIPTKVLDVWQLQRKEWLRAHGIDPEHEDWQRKVELLPREIHEEYYRQFTARWHDLLDRCHGECVLLQPSVSAVVAENLHHGDGEHYHLDSFVVMPNHVHVLAGVPGREAMKKLCRNWKSYSAKKINFQLGRTGQFWQWESFDHLVRSQSSLERFRKYIVTNPARAGLKPDDCLVWARKEII